MGIALTGFFLAVAVHIAVWRVSPSTSPRIAGVFLVLAGGLAAALTASVLIRGDDEKILFAVFSYSFVLDVLYMHFYSGVCRSVSLTLLTRLRGSPERTVPLDVLMAEYESS